jgi:hypothetical protein
LVLIRHPSVHIAQRGTLGPHWQRSHTAGVA